MMDLGEGRLKVLSIFSAGLMVGTALAVIVPEGAEAFYDMREHGEGGAENMPNAIVGGALVVGFLVMLILESIDWGGTAAHGHGGRGKSDMSDGEEEAGHRGGGHHSHGGGAGVPIRESPRGGGGGGGGVGGKAGGARGHFGLLEVICGRGRGEGGGGDDTPGADLPMWRLEGFQTLVGILVHSFADGAAVGVAALSPNRGLGILVGLFYVCV
jgi:zinc transporter ZupT